MMGVQVHPAGDKFAGQWTDMHSETQKEPKNSWHFEQPKDLPFPTLTKAKTSLKTKKTVTISADPEKEAQNNQMRNEIGRQVTQVKRGTTLKTENSLTEEDF